MTVAEGVAACYAFIPAIIFLMCGIVLGIQKLSDGSRPSIFDVVYFTLGSLLASAIIFSAFFLFSLFIVG